MSKIIISYRVHPTSKLIKTLIADFTKNNTPSWGDDPNYDSDDYDSDYDPSEGYVFDIDSCNKTFYRQILFNIKLEKKNKRKCIEWCRILQKFEEEHPPVYS